MAPYARIVGTGSYVPARVVTTSQLASRPFHYRGEVLRKSEAEILKATGGIRERRWALPDEDNVAMAVPALRQALKESPGPVDLLLFGHNSDVPIPAVAAIVQGAGLFPPVYSFDLVTDRDTFTPLDAARVLLDSGKYGSVLLADSPAISAVRKPGDILPDVFRREACLLRRDGTRASAPFQDGRLGASVEAILVGHRPFRAPVTRARRVAQALDMREVRGADVVSGCPAFVTALHLAALTIETGRARRVAVIGTDKLTEVADPDHLDITLYGDSAGAVIVEASETPGVIDSHFLTLGEEWTILKLGDGVIDRSRQWLTMEGHDVFRRARSLSDVILPLLKRNGVGIDDVRLYFIHQMNGRILNYTAGKLFGEDRAEEIIDERVPWSIDLYGNSGAGTIPLTLDLVLKDRLRRRTSGQPFNLALGEGTLVLFVSIGAGMILGANLIRL